MIPCDIGMIGLGVMGQNLTLNLAEHGYRVAVYNRRDAGEEEVAAEFITHRCQGQPVQAFLDLPQLVAALSRPRKIFMLVTAGAAVDQLLEQLLPLLACDDILVDGGNAHFRDSERRQDRSETLGVRYVGCGISGGAAGARKGPALMPGGSLSAWDELRPILQTIAARAADGSPCCEWIGPGGAGHFVKLAHNGIEYAQMQLLAEGYDLLRRILGSPPDDVAALFDDWNNGQLRSYLLEITCRILRRRDKDGAPLVEAILDCAEQKGSGKEIVIAALELGVAVPAMSEAIHARLLSTRLDERRVMAGRYGKRNVSVAERDAVVSDLHQALLCAQLAVLAQGVQLMVRASEVLGWGLDLTRIFRVWQGGCIIRSQLLAELQPIVSSSSGNPLLAAPAVVDRIVAGEEGWRRTVRLASGCGVPIPVLASTLSWFDGLRSDRLPANLIQAQRDYFGAHRFERRDAPRGVFSHADWEDS